MTIAIFEIDYVRGTVQNTVKKIPIPLKLTESTFAFSYISRYAEYGRLAFIYRVAGHNLGYKERTILAETASFERRLTIAHLISGHHDRTTDPGILDIFECQACEFIMLISELLASHRICLENMAIEVLDEHDIARMIEQKPEFILTRAIITVVYNGFATEFLHD